MPPRARIARVAPTAAPVAPDESDRLAPQAGFVIKTSTSIVGDKWFLNCCAHNVVDRPQGKGTGKVVDDVYLDGWGIANTDVPLHVCSKRPCEDKGGSPATAVDVVFNPAVVERAADSHPQCAAFRSFMCDLATAHVSKEYGVRFEGKGKIIRSVYKGGRRDGTLPLPIPELVQIRDEHLQRSFAGGRGEATPPHVPPKKKLVQEFDSWEEVEAHQKGRAQHGLHEPSRSGSDGTTSEAHGESQGGGVIKRGFLAHAGGKLYPKGSTEGTPAPNAGDPLGWMPEKLRSRVCTVDTATMSEEQQQAMMRMHAGVDDTPPASKVRRSSCTRTCAPRALSPDSARPLQYGRLPYAMSTQRPGTQSERPCPARRSWRRSTKRQILKISSVSCALCPRA